jgi:hypothetical protein
MNRANWTKSTLAALACAALLVACGGGGGDASNSLDGTAATGIPLAGAKVYLTDSRGSAPTGQDESNGTALVSTDETGRYSFSSTQLNGLTPPFMVRVVGQTVNENGDKTNAVLHALSLGGNGAKANITPLTEAHTALTLGNLPSLSYGTSNALTNVTNTSLQAANTKLATALAPVVDFGSSPNFVTDALDATTGAAVDSNARKHDTTLDQLSMSVSNGQIVLADRNQDDSNYANGPRVVISGRTQQASLPAGALSSKVTPLNLSRAKDFATRFTTQLALGCVLDSEPTPPTAGACDAVTASTSNVFHANFKDKGMSPWRWLMGWLSDAFETTDLTGVRVSLMSANLGSFETAGQRVYRVLLKFTKDSDVVMRPMLVVDDGTQIKAYGNQQDFFFGITPRMNYRVDGNGLYPYYPQYEVGLTINLKHWFGSQNSVIFGAHIKGPGLPSTRQSGYSATNGLTAGSDTNRNNLSDGIEVFDRRAYGCSAFPIEPSVFSERNLLPWANRGNLTDSKIRWRPDSATCNPLFDMVRYDSNRSGDFTPPKKGDTYTVTLYLDASKFAPNTSVPVPSGASAAVSRKNSDGDTKSVYPYTFTHTLQSDAFVLPDASFNPATFGFPGISNSTRESLASLQLGDDLSVSWQKNRTTLSDGTVFGSFYVGRSMSAYDQWRTYDSSGPNASGIVISSAYNDTTTYYHDAANKGTTLTAAGCGKTVTTKVRNGSIITIPLIRKGTSSANYVYSLTTCATKDIDLASAKVSDATASLVYSNQRYRKQYVSDRGRLVATNDTSQVLRFIDLLSRESQSSYNFCSAYDGLLRSRQVYVQLSDISGRTIMEMRELWWDYPNKDVTIYTNGSSGGDSGAVASDRPSASTDLLYLANPSDYNGSRGYINPVRYKSGAQCVDKTW